MKRALRGPASSHVVMQGSAAIVGELAVDPLETVGAWQCAAFVVSNNREARAVAVNGEATAGRERLGVWKRPFSGPIETPYST